MDLMKWFKEVPKGIDGTELPSNRIFTLEQLLQEKVGDKANLEQVHRFRSRKNVVVYLKLTSNDQKPVELVAKMFATSFFDKEQSILTDSWKGNLAVPELIAAKKGVILMSHIPGELLVDRINRTFNPHLIELLAQWYFKFHSIHNKIKGDPRLRNFICGEQELYGIDFEESCSGPWMLDIAGVSASLLDTDPIFDRRKKKLSWHFLNSYLSLLGEIRTTAFEDEFTTAIATALKQTAVWRKDEKIHELSERILAEGLSEE